MGGQGLSTSLLTVTVQAYFKALPSYETTKAGKRFGNASTQAFLFLQHLDNASQSGKQVSLQDLATNLTFDAVGRVVLDIDMTYTDEQITLPWWCTHRVEWRRYRLAKRARDTLKSIVRERYTQLGQAAKSHSISSMSLQGVKDPNPKTIDVTCDQLSTFLFAGHDTTSTTLSWAFYELSRTSRALRAVCSELDELFGLDPSPASVHTRLTGPAGEKLAHRMTYTTAVIKKVLRLWPPGGTVLYLTHSIIHHDPAVFDDTADAFVPERWLQQGAPDKIPAGAWRAFERGPRGCIGQELAMRRASLHESWNWSSVG
ncbi:hypothetical protein MGN70_008429 [Eutypa lata]|nr:hypothetical protein MGN70_008429 [Eutypa lata]